MEYKRRIGTTRPFEVVSEGIEESSIYDDKPELAVSVEDPALDGVFEVIVTEAMDANGSYYYSAGCYRRKKLGLSK